MASGKDNELPLSHRKDEKAVLLFYEAGFDARRMLAMRRFLFRCRGRRFAANVIGSVAKGRGTQITGDKAVDAFNAYMRNIPPSSLGSNGGDGSAAGAEIPISPDGGINAGRTGT